MRRRHLLLALPLPALAHHGWSSFDQDRPIYLTGTAERVRWANPHAELLLARDVMAALPADLAQRKPPAQSAPVDGAALLARAQLPRRGDPQWEVELAPLTRMSAWGVPEIKPGQRLELLGFTFKDEAGSATLRAEFLWLDGKVYGLRSSPA
jgi:hypothetical protein